MKTSQMLILFIRGVLFYHQFIITHCTVITNSTRNNLKFDSPGMEVSKFKSVAMYLSIVTFLLNTEGLR